MDTVLSPETQKLLEEKLSSGGYRSADDVVHAALEALNELESYGLDPETQAAIEEGLAQADRGEGRPWEEVREELRTRFTKK